MDIAKGEMIEAETDANEHRRQTEGERLTEELWMPSAWAYAARLRSTLSRLVAHHEAEAEKCRKDGHRTEELIEEQGEGVGS